MMKTEKNVNMISWITQETNPVYWAYTHCLTLEPLDSYNPTFILTLPLQCYALTKNHLICDVEVL